MAIKLKCLVCGCVIQSKSRHDFVQCDCNNCFVDGGDDYCRIGIQDKGFVEVWDEKSQKFTPYLTDEELEMKDETIKLAVVYDGNSDVRFVYFYPKDSVYIDVYAGIIEDNKIKYDEYSVLDGIKDGLIKYIDEKNPLYEEYKKYEMKDAKLTDYVRFYLMTWDDNKKYILKAQKN